MGRTLLQVITKVSEILDPKHYMTGTTDSSGNAVGSVVDTGLQRFNNEQIVGKSFYFSGGTPSPDTVNLSQTSPTGKNRPKRAPFSLASVDRRISSRPTWKRTGSAASCSPTQRLRPIRLQSVPKRTRR